MDLSKVLPDGESIRAHKQLLRNVVLTKVQKYLAAQAALRPQLESLKANRWQGVETSPALVAWVSRPQGQRYDDELLELLQTNTQEIRFHHRDYAPWAKELVRFHNEQNPGFHLSDFQGDGAYFVQRFRDALVCLEDLWPEAAYAVRSLVQDIVLVHGEELWSGSIPSYHGAIIVCPKTTWTMAHYIETLVHEAAHLELNIRRMVDPLVTNPMALSFSPLRRSDRPILGVFHAGFVLIRTVTALKKLQHSQRWDKQSSSTQALIAGFGNDLVGTLEGLQASAVFSPLGAQLFAHMQAQGRLLC